MKRLFLVLLLLAVGLLIYSQSANWLGKNAPGKASQTDRLITVQQKISGQADFSSHQIAEAKTALDLLNQTGSAVTVGEGENAYVVGINGIKAEKEKKEFWSFYVNDKMSPVGAGSYQLKNGDKIEWRIEKY